MKRRIELLDTSIILPLLGVPSKDQERTEVEEGVDSRTEEGVQLLLPVATVLETGARIGEILDGSARRWCAEQFQTLLWKTLEHQAPWSFYALTWDDAFVARLAATDNLEGELVECLESRRLQMGDLVILHEFNTLRANLKAQYLDIDVWTLDTQLRAAVDYIRSG